jgi:hypothetical protein
MLRDGVPIEVVSRCRTRSYATTSVYGHLTAQDAAKHYRRRLVRGGEVATSLRSPIRSGVLAATRRPGAQRDLDARRCRDRMDRGGLPGGGQPRRGLFPRDPQVFHAWRAALTLVENSEVTARAGSTYLHATTHRNRVRVRLTATVHDEEPNGVVTA